MSAINRLLLTGATAALLTLSASTAEARPFRVTQIPNGADFACTSCHTTRTGGPRNTFGTAVSDGFTTTATTAPAGWGPVLAGLDSDGDGFTNGQELGDPDGTWTVGDPNPVFDATNPGDPSSFPAVTDPDAGSDTGADSGTDATEDTGTDTAVEPDTTPEPDTAVEQDTTPSPDTATDDAATSADTGTTGTTDDRKVADDGCSSAGNGGASLLGLFGLALLARRRPA
jgi:dopamine beta-monooxygenase